LRFLLALDVVATAVPDDQLGMAWRHHLIKEQQLMGGLGSTKSTIRNR
jgi:hypothetical protein